MNPKYLFALAIWGFFLPSPPATKAGTTTTQEDPRRVDTLRLTGAPPTIDGRLTEKFWKILGPATGFRQAIPNPGAPATERTEVRFARDDEALYVGARMYSRDPSQILASVARRDHVTNSERIIVALDTYRDRRTACSFGLTATGVRVDYAHPSDREFDRRYTFDPVWEGKSHVDDLGWTAEFRIPFSQLRYGENTVWGLNLNRWIPTGNQDAYWIHIPRDEVGWASRFGDLHGLEDLPRPRRIELLPYAATSLVRRPEAAPLDPFSHEDAFQLRGGLDLKMGLGPNLTLDGTINPDFGQVEADPAQVNLSDFETTFPERRPFFTSEADLFSAPGPRWFYSRRIGSRPSVPLPDSLEFSSYPDHTTILGAAKLTGRLESGLSVGVLSAWTTEEHARGYDTDSQRRVSIPVQPTSQFGVLRLSQEFGPDLSTAGLLITGMRRDLAPVLRAHFPEGAFTTAADWTLSQGGGEYTLYGSTGFSHVYGSPESIAAIQARSAHYFQRPDATHVSFDPSRTSLTGFTAGLEWERRAGEHWLWNLGASAESPDFELNDSGKLLSADDLNARAGLRFREVTPATHWREYSMDLGAETGWNFGGTRAPVTGTLRAAITWPSYLRTSAELLVNSRGQSDTRTRGGPLAGEAGGFRFSADVNSNRARQSRWGASVGFARSEFAGRSGWMNTDFSWQSGRWELVLSPGIRQERDPRQYVTSIAGGPAETFGTRYVFARIDRTTLTAPVRLNYALTPDLTVEFYGEAFAASGAFSGFGELPAPGSYDLRVYGRDAGEIAEEFEAGHRTWTVRGLGAPFSFRQDDFRLRSFRSNLVLRWEWSPGSTLYAVWQEDRSGGEPGGNAVGLGSLRDALSDSGDQYWALKLSYWLPV